MANLLELHKGKIAALRKGRPKILEFDRVA